MSSPADIPPQRPKYATVRCTCISDGGKRIVADPDCPWADSEREP